MSNFSEKIDDDLLKEDCEKLKQYNDKECIEKLLSEELHKIIDDNRYTYEETIAIYKYYGRLLNRLKGE